MQQEFGVDDGFDVAVLGVEAAEEIQHLAGLVHRVADVAKVVAKLLEVGSVLRHGEVALLESVEFRLVVDGALHLIIAEDAFNIVPDGESRGVELG